MKRIALAALLATLTPIVAARAPGAPGHSHETFTAGEPGDPKKPARVVQITMKEEDGKMLFIPDRVEVRKGEQIKFVLRNNGELAHEFMLASKAENDKHAELMQKYPDMEHDDPNGKTLQTKKSTRPRLEIHQGRRVRVCLPHSRPSRGGHARQSHREVNAEERNGP